MYDSCNVLLAGKTGDVMNKSTGSPSSCDRVSSLKVTVLSLINSVGAQV